MIEVLLFFILIAFCYWAHKFYSFLKEWEWWLKSINRHIYDIGHPKKDDDIVAKEMYRRFILLEEKVRILYEEKHE